MKKILFGLCICGFLVGEVFSAPKETLRVSSSAEVEAGYLNETVVLTDTNGEIFLEFPKSLKVLYTESRASFSGEILSPARTTLPAQSPKTRMKELFSFELVADAGEQLFFTDRISTLHPRNRLRESILNPENIESGSRPKLLYVLSDESIRNPRLWRFVNEEEGWEKVGGVVLEGGENRIFTAKIFLTGTYTIFDENPISTDTFDDYVPEATIESLSSNIERLQNQLLEMKRSQGLLEDEGGLFFEQQNSVEDELMFTSQEFSGEIPSLEDPNEESQEFFENDESSLIPAVNETGDLVLPPGDDFGTAQSLNSDISIPQNARLPQTGIENDSSGNPLWTVLGMLLVVLSGAGVYVFWKGAY